MSVHRHPLIDEGLESPSLRREKGDANLANKSDFQLDLYDTIWLKKLGYQQMERYEVALRIWVEPE